MKAMTQPAKELLIQRAKAGDVVAWEQLIIRNSLGKPVQDLPCCESKPRLHVDSFTCQSGPLGSDDRGHIASTGDPQPGCFSIRSTRPSRSRQRRDHRRLVMQINVRVDIHRQSDVAVPRQRLGHLGRNAGLFQARDEQMPQAVEVSVAAGVIAVAEEVRLLRTARLGIAPAFLQPVLSRRVQVDAHHLERLAVGAAGYRAREGNTFRLV